MTTTIRTLAITLLVASAAGAAQQPPVEREFPGAQTHTKQCKDIEWSTEMLQNHPGLIGACREVVVVDDRKWARFEARYVGMTPDGSVEFRVWGPGDRPLEPVLLETLPGQVAYIDDKPVPFAQLRRSDVINLYMPENRYGFVAAPAATPIAKVIPPATEPKVATAAPSTTFAAVEPLPDRLPATAGPLPWFLLAGVLLVVGGAGLTVLRWRLRSARNADRPVVTVS